MAGKNVTIGNVNISMSANAAALIRQVTKAENTFGKKVLKMAKSAKKFTKSMVGMAAKMGKLAGMIGGAGVTAFTALAVQTYQAQREMQRMSDVAGVSLEKFTQMSHITKSLGLETEYLADGMKDLNVRIVDAAKGGGTMVDFFALMGENAADWIDLDPAEQLDKFISITSKLGKNESKFWADEVNDSMYRLSVTLNRSGKTMKQFTDESKSLGAGTASMFIGNVNGMYESFNKLMTLVGEFKGTTFGLLAKSFGAAFDGMTGQLKEFLGEGDNASENIFNMSKKIATYVLTMLSTIYKGIHAFINKTLLLLGKFDSSFTDGLFSTDTMQQVDVLDSKISNLRDLISESSGEGFFKFLTKKQTPETIANMEKGLATLVAKRDALLSNTGDSAFVETLDALLKDLNEQTFALAQAATVKPNSGGAESSGQDPAELIAALKYLEAIKKTSGVVEDSKLKEINLNKENLEVLVAHYNQLLATKGANKVISQGLEEAYEELYLLDVEEQVRLEELRQERLKKEQEEADKKVEIHQNMLQARLAFEQQYGSQYQAMTVTAEALEKARLQALRDQEVITKEEHLAALTQLTQDKANSEVQMELTKLSDIATGLQAFTGQSKTMAKAAFAFTQGKALQEVIVQQAQAVSAAWADPTLPWYSKAGAAVMAAANVGKQIMTIKQAGQFHDGGEIPYDGTYYMEGGEMVIPRDRVGEYIDAAGKGGSGETVINSTINMGANLVDEKVMAQALSKQQSVLATLIRREEKNRPARARTK